MTAHVVGAFTTAFGAFPEHTLGVLAQRAAEGALGNAGVTAGEIGCVLFANAAEGVLTGQEMIRAQVALAGSELAGVPMIDVENACASGGSAVHLAAALVDSGRYERVLVLGVEKLIHPDKARSFAAIRAGVDQSLPSVESGGSVMMGHYAAEARAWAADRGPLAEALAAVAVKNRRHARDNPNAQYRKEISADDVAASRMVADPLRLLMCAPLTDGAAAVVVSARAGSGPRIVIAAAESASYRRGEPVVRRAMQKLRTAGGFDSHDVDVWQVHDACAFAEIAQYEQVGIAAPGEGARAVLEGRTSLGGDAPVNTDGGLLSRGHPLGATGVAQVVELVRQLRGGDDLNLVAGARLGVAVNGGGWMGDDYAACAATLLIRQ